MTTPAELAAGYFNETFNCSQSVFAAFAPQLGIPEKVALKLGSPFGGGFARQGEVCGAVTGALLALGLAKGAEVPAGKGDIYRIGQELLDEFKSRHGSLLCRELIGCSIATAEGYEAAAEKGVFRTICPALVRDAVELVQARVDATA